MPIDTRIAMLSLDSLAKVEMAYSQTFIYVHTIDPFLASGKLKGGPDVSYLVKIHAIGLRQFVNSALKSLEGYND